MIKFWKDDFRYIKRINFTGGGYIYIFSVRGESSNYLRNKYYLQFPNIQVNLFTIDNSMSIGSKTNNKLHSDITDMEEEDTKELLSLLQENVDIDLINYEEYICNDIYQRDTRWR